MAGERLILLLRRDPKAAIEPRAVSGRKVSNSGSISVQNSRLKRASPTSRSNWVSPSDSTSV